MDSSGRQTLLYIQRCNSAHRRKSARASSITFMFGCGWSMPRKRNNYQLVYHLEQGTGRLVSRGQAGLGKAARYSHSSKMRNRSSKPVLTRGP
jgi:hypothetical protein